LEEEKAAKFLVFLINDKNAPIFVNHKRSGSKSSARVHICENIKSKDGFYTVSRRRRESCGVGRQT
jgi:hypothetical protein